MSEKKLVTLKVYSDSRDKLKIVASIKKVSMQDCFESIVERIYPKVIKK